MKLPIPIKFNGKIYDDIELKEYTAGTIAETQKASFGNVYRAMAVFIAGCVKTINGEAERGLIRDIIGHMSFSTAEYVLLKALTSDEDGIEGVYPCPRCGTKIISEKTDAGDTRDFVSQIPVNYCDGEAKINIELDSPIEIKEAGDNEVSDILSIGMGYPTLTHLSNASGKWPETDSYRIELQAYLEAVEGISGGPIEKKWLSRYGMMVMERLSGKDVKKIQVELKRYGMNPVVKKKCSNCGKEFEATLNTTGLFASALR